MVEHYRLLRVDLTPSAHPRAMTFIFAKRTFNEIALQSSARRIYKPAQT
jgi:hypothetical protein